MTGEDYARRSAYYREVARRVGVPDLYLEDAAHDIHLRVWRSGHDYPTAIKRAAIDARRHYAGDNRRQPRPRLVALYDDLDAVAAGPDLDTLIDFRAAWARLDARRRGLLLAEVDAGPRPNDNARHGRVFRARRALRALMAG